MSLLRPRRRMTAFAILCLLFIHPRAPNLIGLRLPGPCLHDFVVCSRSALGTSANTNTKLLIYDLFQKGRVWHRTGSHPAVGT